MEPVLPGVQAQLPPGMLRSLPKPVACLPRGGSLSFARPAWGRQRANISRSPSQAGEACSCGQDPGGRQGGPAGVPAAIGAVPALLGGQARPAERLRCWQEPAGLPAALPLPAYMGSRGGGAGLSLPLRHPGIVRDSERSGAASNGSGFAEMGRKLDLSKLTDEEAKHVWEVVQRDFDLRKKEEERLEELKCKIDQESSKREFLTSQSHLNETHCVHCLQPFKFLLNSKRQCLDCRFYTCKNCSRYHKKEQGWVCDPCRLSRIVKIGSLEWYYEHVRSRFKRFGSAKVLQSLYGRLQPGQGLNSAFLGLHDRVYSLPDINRECQLLSSCDPGDDSDEEDNVLRGAEAEHYSRMCKTKRLLSVHPFDFELDSDYSAQSRRQSAQLSPAASSPDAFQSFPDFPTSAEDVSQESKIRDADLVFHHVLQEPGPSAPEQHFSTEVRLTVNARRRRSLERNTKPGLLWNEPPRARYSADMDTSDEELRGAQLPAQPSKRRNRASSQENISHSSNQIHELNTRMSAIERVLNRLEEKILARPDESLAPESHTDPDAEEEELKRKLEELASNISDKEVSSDEEEREEEKRAKKEEMNSSSEAMTRDVRKVYLAAGKTYQLEKTLKELEEGAQHSGTTDSELSELEDKVASAAAQVQQAESEISDIESRIAALSAAGLTVKSVEKAKKAKSSVQAACLHSPAPASSSPGESLDDIKAMPGLQRFRRKFNSPLEITSFDDSFDRNSAYRGSLTQRNPNGKNRRVERLFAKPVMTHLS
ncbi:melanophilin isoform 4-T4 [Geothlypis trichas]